MLDSSWTRVGLILDSRWTGFDLFSVQFLCELPNSCWTHAGLMLDSSWAVVIVFRTRTEHSDTCWTHVGLALDSCWTRVGLGLTYCQYSFCCSFLTSCWAHVGLMMDSLGAGTWFFVKNSAMEANNPFRTLKF